MSGVRLSILLSLRSSHLVVVGISVGIVFNPSEEQSTVFRSQVHPLGHVFRIAQLTCSTRLSLRLIKTV